MGKWKNAALRATENGGQDTEHADAEGGVKTQVEREKRGLLGTCRHVLFVS